MVGKEWFSALMKRNPELSLRLPNVTSVSRATAFNETAVMKFLDNLERFIDIELEKIYNVDKTGISKVAKLPKILAQRGKARVALGTRGERDHDSMLHERNWILCAIHVHLQKIENGSTSHE